MLLSIHTENGGAYHLRATSRPQSLHTPGAATPAFRSPNSQPREWPQHYDGQYGDHHGFDGNGLEVLHHRCSLKARRPVEH